MTSPAGFPATGVAGSLRIASTSIAPAAARARRAGDRQQRRRRGQERRGVQETPAVHLKLRCRGGEAGPIRPRLSHRTRRSARQSLVTACNLNKRAGQTAFHSKGFSDLASVAAKPVFGLGLILRGMGGVVRERRTAKPIRSEISDSLSDSFCCGLVTMLLESKQNRPRRSLSCRLSGAIVSRFRHPVTLGLRTLALGWHRGLCSARYAFLTMPDLIGLTLAG